MKITLVRHPQTIANQKKIIYGKTNFPYTKLGEEQIKSIVTYFEQKCLSKKVKIVTSPAERAAELALQTGSIIGIMPRLEKRLGEMDFGIFEGKTIEEIKENYQKEYEDFVYRFETTCIPGGESYQEFRQRIHEYVATLSKEDEVILFTHGAVIREILEHMLSLTPGDSWKFSINNGTIIELEEKVNGIVIQQIIQVEEL